MKSVEALFRGYVIFRVNDRWFMTYEGALAYRNFTPKTEPVHFSGLHLLKGWRSFFIRATPSRFPSESVEGNIFGFGIEGIDVEIPRSLLTPRIWHSLVEGTYETCEISLLRSVVRVNDKVLEIGAGIGFISSYISKQLGARSVTAVEANGRLIPIIKRTHKLNEVRATVIHAAASNKDGTIEFFEHESFWASSLVENPDRKKSIVPSIDLSKLLRDVRPDVLVVDIEGAEKTIFENVDLSSVRDIVVEVHPQFLPPDDIERCCATLSAAAYTEVPHEGAGNNKHFSRT